MKKRVLTKEQSFNSLQTGRRFQTDHRYALDMRDIVFQFPSNGKAVPNSSMKTGLSPEVVTFQFPSNGKAVPNIGR